MAEFAIYDLATGAVKRTTKSTSPRALELAQARLTAGEGVYEGHVDPKTTYLPGGVPTPRPPEAVVIGPVQVKQWAGRLLSYTDWYVTRRADTGEDIPADVLTYRQAVRDASGEIEAMDPIPEDYRNPDLWPAIP